MTIATLTLRAAFGKGGGQIVPPLVTRREHIRTKKL